MRRAMFFLAVLGFGSALWAADPHIGTWKLNAAKSKYSPVYLAMTKEAAPKEITMVIRENGDHFEVASTGTRTDGSKMSDKHSMPTQGGVASFDPPGLPKEMSIIFTTISPNEWYITVLNNGKQLGVVHHLISKDGKVLTDTLKGVDPQGKSFEQIAVYDKQ